MHFRNTRFNSSTLYRLGRSSVDLPGAARGGGVAQTTQGRRQGHVSGDVVPGPLEPVTPLPPSGQTLVSFEGPTRCFPAVPTVGGAGGVALSSHCPFLGFAFLGWAWGCGAH